MLGLYVELDIISGDVTYTRQWANLTGTGLGFFFLSFFLSLFLFFLYLMAVYAFLFCFSLCHLILSRSVLFIQ